MVTLCCCLGQQNCLLFTRRLTSTLKFTWFVTFQSLNDYSPTQSVPSQFARACLDSIVLALESPQSRDNVMYQNLKNLLSQVERLVCPSQCNGRGQCVNGKCVCNSGSPPTTIMLVYTVLVVFEMFANWYALEQTISIKRALNIVMCHASNWNFILSNKSVCEHWRSMSFKLQQFWGSINLTLYH